MDHETIRTLTAVALAVAQIGAFAGALLVFWWAFKLLEELTRYAQRIAEDLHAAPYVKPPPRKRRTGRRTGATVEIVDEVDKP